MALLLHAVADRKADPALTVALKVAKVPAKAVAQKVDLTPAVTSARRVTTHPEVIAVRAAMVMNCLATPTP